MHQVNQLYRLSLKLQKSLIPVSVKKITGNASLFRRTSTNITCYMVNIRWTVYCIRYAACRLREKRKAFKRPPEYKTEDKTDSLADFINRHVEEGPLFGKQVGKSALDFDPNAAKFDAIEKFDSTIGKTDISILLLSLIGHF